MLNILFDRLPGLIPALGGIITVLFAIIGAVLVKLKSAQNKNLEFKNDALRAQRQAERDLRHEVDVIRDAAAPPSGETYEIDQFLADAAEPVRQDVPADPVADAIADDVSQRMLTDRRRRGSDLIGARGCSRGVRRT